MVQDGVVLVDRSFERIDVTSHLLRHATATVQRQQYGVPPGGPGRAMGYAFAADGQAPEATRYYSQMTETQEAEIRHEAILAIMDDARLAVRVIEPEEEAQRISRLMEEADERTREVLERYGALHPSRSATAATQVCASEVRTRLLHRLPIPGMPTGVLDGVEFVHEGYLKAARAHERMGDLAGAHERHSFDRPVRAAATRDAAAGRSRATR
jgi:hypothetical protein